MKSPASELWGGSHDRSKGQEAALSRSLFVSPQPCDRQIEALRSSRRSPLAIALYLERGIEHHSNVAAQNPTDAQ
jgi:hypothetical protein